MGIGTVPELRIRVEFSAVMSIIGENFVFAIAPRKPNRSLAVFAKRILDVDYIPFGGGGDRDVQRSSVDPLFNTGDN